MYYWGWIKIDGMRQTKGRCGLVEKAYKICRWIEWVRKENKVFLVSDERNRRNGQTQGNKVLLGSITLTNQQWVILKK